MDSIPRSLNDNDIVFAQFKLKLFELANILYVYFFFDGRRMKTILRESVFKNALFINAAFNNKQNISRHALLRPRQRRLISTFFQCY